MASFEVTDEAARFVAEALADEENADRLALWIEVTGSSKDEFDYDVYFQEFALRSPADLLVERGSVRVVIPADSLVNLDGARLELSSDGELAIVNPNKPAKIEDFPDFGPEALTSEVARQVIAVLDEEINPSIAAHGGYAELVGVVDDTAYVLMGGGCQGCGLASVTLSQGIVVAIQDKVPEIKQVVDVTNHAAGNNPYYQPAKK